MILTLVVDEAILWGGGSGGMEGEREREEGEREREEGEREREEGCNI